MPCRRLPLEPPIYERVWQFSKDWQFCGPRSLLSLSGCTGSRLHAQLFCNTLQPDTFGGQSFHQLALRYTYHVHCVARPS
jgi:hypothetical protein